MSIGVDRQYEEGAVSQSTDKLCQPLLDIFCASVTLFGGTYALAHVKSRKGSCVLTAKYRPANSWADGHAMPGYHHM